MPVPTIEDVANAAGVSKATVSRVLNGDYTYIRDKTRERVQRAIADLGYRPSSVARSLTSKRTQTIGILITDVSNLFYSDVIHGVEDIAIQQHYNVFLGNISYDLERGLALVQSLIDRRVDGVLIMSSTMSDDWLDELTRNHVPVVVLDWEVKAPKEGIGSIYVDYETGINEAADHLIELGHRRFAHVSGPLHLQTSRARRDTFFKRLAERGIPDSQMTLIEGNFRIDGGRKACAELLSMPDRPTAVFAGNDLMANGILNMAHVSGLQLPRDLSVIGLDDIWLAAQMEPALTTVALPQYQIGQQAVQMLFEMLNSPKGKPVEPLSAVIKTGLVKRASTAPVEK